MCTHQKFDIYKEIKKSYPEYPTEMLLDMFRIVKKYKNFNLPDLSGKFQLNHYSVGKMGIIRILDELKLLSKSEWKYLQQLVPQMKDELTKRYEAKSLKNDLARFIGGSTKFFGHISAINNDDAFQYICVDHLKLFETGENIGNTVSHIWLRKIIKSNFNVGDFIIFEAYGFRYKSDTMRKFGLKLVDDNAIRVISLKDAKKWYSEKKEDARTHQLQMNSRIYGKPKTYSKFNE